MPHDCSLARRRASALAEPRAGIVGAPEVTMKLDGERLESLYTTMVKIRRFDEKTAELFVQGLVKGTAHSYVGEEAVAAAACANLREDDYIVGTHRGHGHCIAKGARVDRMMAELFGRVDGYCRGLGGSMHIAALDLNILGCNGIVAAGLPIGTGAAVANRIRRTDGVVIAFFGDGGANQGVVHESLNLAAVWKLPIIYLCENNQYALSTASTRTTAGESIAGRAAAYGIPGVRVDGNDVLAVYEATKTAVARARAGQGPTLIEAVTYRWGGHSMRANLPDYRTKEEEREWMEKDPIARLREEMERRGASVMSLKELEESVEAELDRAVRFATASIEPTVEIMESSVYAPHAPATVPMDQVVNQAAKFRYMLGGGPTVPLVIRGPQGGGIRLAAQHSQSLEAWFAHVPGLVVVAPSTPYDAKGLLASAIRDDNPVIFLEHKALYAVKGPVPAESYAIPLGRADIKRVGSDVTVVATQAMVARALAAAGDLEKDNVSVEVIDPRTIVPLDEATILASVRKTHRLVVVHEAVKRSGFGAELAAIVAEKAIDDLDAPIVRVGARAVPMPYNDALERAAIPTQADIAEAIRSLF